MNWLGKELKELLLRTVGPSVRIQHVSCATVWPTLVDPNQLENVLLNLRINARDAMPSEGDIVIEAANRSLVDSGEYEGGLPAGDYVTLCVTDTGAGMSAEVIARAFDPFFTTKPIGFGTGLGLSMTYGFARQSGGHVRIHSELAKGTTVSLYLPRYLGLADEAEVLKRPTRIEHGEHAEIILIVDDESIVRMLITDVLAELGYSSIEASDGAAGLAVLQSDTRVDLLITDVGLPGGINGRQLADAARQSRAALKVIFITGYAESAVLNYGHLGPGMRVLVKPFAIDVLRKTINELMP